VRPMRSPTTSANVVHVAVGESRVGSRWTRPPALDVLLALGLAALVQLEIWGSDVTVPKALAVPVGLLMTLPLAWRRRVPLAVVAVVMGALAVQSVLDSSEQPPQTPFLALVVAVYSVAAYTDRKPALIGGGISLVVILLSEPGDFIVAGPLYTGVWLAGRLYRDRQRLAAALQSRTVALEREQEETARLAIAEERARIARELHDVVAHSVSVMVVQAGAERLALGPGQDSTRETLVSIEKTGRQALGEMRRLLGMLRRDDEELALAPLPSLDHLDSLVAHVREAGLPVELHVEGTRQTLPAGVDISAYRIVQEALTNALRHAGPARARVVVRYGDAEVEVEVADDGHGPQEANGGGHGLVGMRERVTLYGGELQACLREGGGYAVRARLPFDRARA
jgi:signal transduction histidine kinase